jgi:hypothetical protein
VRLDRRGGCAAPASHHLAALAADARARSGADHSSSFTLTVAGGTVHRVQEFVAINACRAARGTARPATVEPGRSCGLAAQ